ncbi:MAG: 4-hydroxy-3-methylbut-2-enyl diphosphate reductase [Hyphomicrobiales bacterium]|nr:4-hydroxy-3-methylbut-2-enyl diphosphate reductase [Hyphomicrobiales bacterium]
MASPPLDILLAAPRGFCAGVDRAVQIVERALAEYGAPVYVRHEIVHNRFVVDGLKKRGAVFVEELDEIPDRTRPVVFSAHGVPKSVPEAAERLGLFSLDATCPLVTKVHRAAESHHAKGRHVLLIGHAGHPEVIGTMGQLPDGAVTLVTSVADAETVVPPAGAPLAYTTQTTLSLDDTRDIVEVLGRRFPEIAGPHRQDICYATTNRQEAVKAVAPRVEAMIVVGAPNSSNSQRLREVAERAGCRAVLLMSAADIDWPSFEGVTRLGITAGASAPEVLVEEMIAAFAARREVRVETVVTAEETVVFNLPKALRRDVDDREA